MSEATRRAPLAVVDGLNPKTKAVPAAFIISLEALPPAAMSQVSVLDPNGGKATFCARPCGNTVNLQSESII